VPEVHPAVPDSTKDFAAKSPACELRVGKTAILTNGDRIILERLNQTRQAILVDDVRIGVKRGGELRLRLRVLLLRRSGVLSVSRHNDRGPRRPK
jgi:hypothetical protein